LDDKSDFKLELRGYGPKFDAKTQTFNNFTEDGEARNYSAPEHEKLLSFFKESKFGTSLPIENHHF